jgi:crotonobetainyl-CoA:carnitine CoA-transferase CaiB-like acyl-CoA transferase
VTGADDETSLIAALHERTSAELLGSLAAAGVACGPLNLAQKNAFFDDPANRAAGLVASYPHAEWGTLEQPGALWHFGDLPLHHVLAPPTLGQHSAEILRELGLSDAEVTSLLAEGAVVAPSVTT